MSRLHDQAIPIIFSQGVDATKDTTATKNSSEQGEAYYATDTKQLYIFDGTNYIPVVRAKSDVPSSASDTGTAGQLAYDSDYIYVCIAEDSWKRVGISSW